MQQKHLRCPLQRIRVGLVAVDVVRQTSVGQHCRHCGGEVLDERAGSVSVWIQLQSGWPVQPHFACRRNTRGASYQRGKGDQRVIVNDTLRSFNIGSSTTRQMMGQERSQEAVDTLNLVHRQP